MSCFYSRVSSAGGGQSQSSIQRLTDQQTQLQFPPYTIRKHRAGDIYGYLWPMRKTSKGLQSWPFVQTASGWLLNSVLMAGPPESLTVINLAAVEQDLAS